MSDAGISTYELLSSPEQIKASAFTQIDYAGSVIPEGRADMFLIVLLFMILLHQVVVYYL